MHTVWKGAISFGLVHIPIKMHAATEDKDIHFRQLHKECGLPISYKKTCGNCDKEVGPDDIVKGFEYERNKFVVIKEEEIESIKPESARTIKILDFVDLKEIDPIYYDKTYYLSPDMAGSGAYDLLLAAISQTNKIGIAKISIRSKSSLAAIRVIDNCICMETMHFPDEIRSVNQVPNLTDAGLAKIDDRELQMAKMLVEQLSSEFDAGKYTDEYRSSLIELIEDKIAGESPDIVAAPAAAGPSKVVDLMAALQASLQAVQIPQDPGTDKPKQPRKTKKAAKDVVS